MPIVVVLTSSAVARQLLQFLREHPEYDRGIAGPARDLDVSYPWLHRVLRSMELQGVVEIDRSRRPYRIRLRLERDGSGAEQGDERDPHGPVG